MSASRPNRRVRTGTLVWNPDTHRHVSEWRINEVTDVYLHFRWVGA